MQLNTEQILFFVTYLVNVFAEGILDVKFLSLHKSENTVRKKLHECMCMKSGK